MAQVRFDFGEKKYVIISVRSCHKGDILDITNAQWSLSFDGEEESSGVCQLVRKHDDEVWLKAYINPLRSNTYYDLKFVYDIGIEHLIYPVRVRVVG